jgi:hypothetical protein
VSARATHLKAATENVSVTTIERKQMSNKTNFKRISLALVAALGFSLLASGSAQADIQAGATLTATAVKSTAVAGSETATVKVDFAFTSLGASDAVNDTVTVTAIRTSGAATGGTNDGDWRGPVSADSSNVLRLTQASDVLTAVGLDNKSITFTGYYDIITPTTAGTYTYTFYANYSSDNASVVKPAPVSFTFTVTAANTKPAAAQSSIYLRGNNAPYADNQGDSTIVVSAGTLGASPVAVGYIVWQQRNSDSSTSAVVAESVTAVMTGAGLVGVAAATPGGSAVAANYESLTVYSDGRGGTATITLTTTSMTTWSTKTLTFFSTAKSTGLSAVAGTVSKTGIDSATALRVTLKDANSNNVAGTATNMYIHSSDTKVVTNGLCSVTVSTSLGYGTCSLSGRVADSGTTKIKVANYAYESITTHAALATSFVSPEEVTIKVVGAPKTVKATFDKAAYNPGEEATVTLTFTDGLGNLVDSHTSLSGALAAGLDYNVGTDMTDTIITFGAGVKTYTYVMPSTGQKVVLSYKGGAGLTGTQTADSVTVTVIDPAEEAANSALDAAQEATDAAIAATDAAILAQEAADEAASAAIAAQETAQAAVDAVTALSAEVTKLVAQLATLQKLLNRVAKRVGVKL